MKKLFVIALSTLIVGAGTLTSCSKYAEGPSMALSSKKSRLAGEWVLSAKTLNGVNAIDAGLRYRLSHSSRFTRYRGQALQPDYFKNQSA